jgi:hypothetical protein
VQGIRVALLLVFVLVGANVARGGGVPAISGDDGPTRDVLAFAPSVSPYDLQLIESAIDSAHPQARALIDRVAGRTTIEVGTPPGGAAGVAMDNGRGEYRVILDIPTVNRRLGPRGVNRLVLHELGHVVDFALVPEDLNTRLDGGVPPCLGGAQPGCDDPMERFAESFAKWAMNDIGLNLYIGYAVPPPTNLATWGEPLAQLAAG